MDFAEHLTVARHQWRLIAGVALATLLTTALLTMLTPETYRAQAQIFISTGGAESATDLAQGSTFTQRQVVTYADVVTARIVLEPVAEELGLSRRDLVEQVTAQVPAGTVLINLAVTDRDPDQAAAITNAVAEQFTISVQELERVGADEESPVKASIIEPAEAPSAPVSPSPVRNLLLAGVLGLLLGVAVAFLRDLLDTRIKGESDVQRVTEEPVIGGIFFDKEASNHPLVIEIDPHSPRSEAFRALRTSLLYIKPDEPVRTLLITSTVPGEGKSTTAVNLALTMAETGARVCLIEGDLRRPRMLEYMGLENAAGLTDHLVGRVELEDVLQHHVHNLEVLGCGSIPPNPSELLGSDAMKRLLERLSEQFDYVVIDAPPVLAVTDASILSTFVDGTMVVVGVGVVRRDPLKKAITTLERMDANILGLVLNRLPVKGPDAYSYYYDSYRPLKQDQTGGRRKRSRTPRKHARHPKPLVPTPTQTETQPGATSETGTETQSGTETHTGTGIETETGTGTETESQAQR